MRLAPDADRTEEVADVAAPVAVDDEAELEEDTDTDEEAISGLQKAPVIAALQEAFLAIHEVVGETGFGNRLFLGPGELLARGGDCVVLLLPVHAREAARELEKTVARLDGLRGPFILLSLAPPLVVLVEAGLLLAVVTHDGYLIAQTDAVAVDQAPVLAAAVALGSLSQDLLGVEHRRLDLGQIALPDAVNILVAEDLALAEDLDGQPFSSRQSYAVEGAVQQGAEQVLIVCELGEEQPKLTRCCDFPASHNHLMD